MHYSVIQIIQCVLYTIRRLLNHNKCKEIVREKLKFLKPSNVHRIHRVSQGTGDQQTKRSGDKETKHDRIEIESWEHG